MRHSRTAGRTSTDPVPEGAAPSGLPPVDLSDPALYGAGDPEPVWALLRERAPLYWNARPNGSFWAATTYDLVTQVLKEADVFVSGHGMRLDADPAATEAAADRMLIVSDGRRHAALRRIIGAAFTPRMVQRLAANVTRTAAEVVDEALERGECDLTQSVARLPVAVICDLLGVPESDRDFMLNRTMRAFDGSTPPPKAAEAHADILVYYGSLIDHRRRSPGDDVVSALVHGHVDGVPLTDDEIRLNCDGLISGANETTRHAVIGGVRALMEHPEQWRSLRERPDALPGAVEEILRYTSPALHVMRTAVRDTELAGQPITAGQRVALWLPSANRDERVFPSGGKFAVDRAPGARHVAFAHGPHFCVGSALASLELRAVFTEFLARVGRADPTAEPRRLYSNLIWGYTSFPVSLRAR